VGSPVLALETAGAGLNVSWSQVANATSYDLVAGSLSALRSTDGDFAAATAVCAGSNVPGTAAIIPAPDPLPGDGIYVLVRAVGSGCKGSYADGSSFPPGGRDAGIAGAVGGCL
jgi:hypothetical protein